MQVNGSLETEEVRSEDGTLHFRYSKYLSADGSRWIRHGLLVAYDLDGSIAGEVTYSHDIEEGPCRHYHRNGQLASSGTLKAGKEDGQWKFYDENGVLERTTIYCNGVEV
jgi:antitoxin component YwqK of YwqJK toxin-antitoxin module